MDFGIAVRDSRGSERIRVYRIMLRISLVRSTSIGADDQMRMFVVQMILGRALKFLFGFNVAPAQKVSRL
jgi:hypothetical protein